MNISNNIGKMLKKRGKILIVVGIILLFYTILTFAQGPTGCCTNRELGLVCVEGVEISACCDPLTEQECKDNNYFFEDTCANIPGQMCGASGTCVGVNEPDPLASPPGLYCIEPLDKAECVDRDGWVNQTSLPECQSGCCICTNGTDLVYDDSDQDAAIKNNLRECTNYCEVLVAGDFSVDVYNSSIDDPVVCADLVTELEYANLSGYIKEKTTQDPIEGVNVSIQGKIAITDANGYYSIGDLSVALSFMDVVHPDYDNITDLLIDISLGDNYQDFAMNRSDRGNIKITIIDEDGNLEPGVAITLGTFFTKSTDDNGYYEQLNIPYGVYDLVAVPSPDYQAITDTINLNQSDLTLPYELIPVAEGELSGNVVDTNGVNITGALIRLTGGLLTERKEVYSRDQGFFVISGIPLETTGTTTYSLNVLKDDYSPHTLLPMPIEFPQGVKNVVTEVIQLKPFIPGCGYTETKNPEPIDFDDSEQIQGEKAIMLMWVSPCNIVSAFEIERRINDSGNWDPFDYYEIHNILFYNLKDENVSWGSTYQYRIRAVYNLGGTKESVWAYTNSIEMGQEECLDRTTEFCDMINNLVVKCDVNNIVVNVSGKECATKSGGNYECTGPDKTGAAYCRLLEDCDEVSPTCNLDPFYGGHCENPLDCWGSVYDLSENPDENATNFCYVAENQYDDPQCRDCSRIFDCFYYTNLGGKLACKLDDQTCLKARGSYCAWLDLSTAIDPTQGICYEEGYQGTEYCVGWGDKGSMGVNFNQSTCSKLGKCYARADEYGCTSCQNAAYCEPYQTAEACVGSQPIEFDNQTCTLKKSDDTCGLGVCNWNGTHCFKDANADGYSDLMTTGDATSLFITQPTTTTKKENIILNKYSSSIEFIPHSEYDYHIPAIYYCITQLDESCCSEFTELSIAFPVIDLLLDYGDWETWERSTDHLYYLRYYSIDEFGNMEKPKAKSIYVDFTEPEIAIDYRHTKVDEFTGKADLTIDMSILTPGEIVNCTDSLKTFDGLVLDQKLSDTRIEDQFEEIVYLDVSEGNYNYTITCADIPAGNSYTYDEIITIRIPDIDQIYPLPIVRATEATLPTIKFEVKTLIDTQCKLYNFAGDFIDNFDAGSFIPGERQSQTLTYETSLPSNQEHYFKAGCVGIDRNQTIKFAIDSMPPNTSIIEIEGTERGGYYSEQDLRIGISQNIKVTLSCKDEPADGAREFGFGCGPTSYCQKAKGESCDLEFLTDFTEYAGPIEFTDSGVLCYSSNDTGVIDFGDGVLHDAPAQEDPSENCVNIFVNEDLSVKLLEPYDLTAPDWIVEWYESGFDVKIWTNKETGRCAYARNDPNFDFDSAISDGRYFSSIDLHEKELISFPGSLPGRIEDFTEDYTQEGVLPSIDNHYNMYIKCEDPFGYGVLNDEDPGHFDFRWNPSPPVIDIDNTYATDIWLQKVDKITSGLVYMRVQTDDKTTCRYGGSRDQTPYPEYKFDDPDFYSGFEGIAEDLTGSYLDYEWAPGQPNYYREHTQELIIIEDQRTFAYDVICKNRAGNVSYPPVTISFSVDINEVGAIDSKRVYIIRSPTDPTSITGVYFNATTNQPTSDADTWGCKASARDFSYEEPLDTDILPFSRTGEIHHTLSVTNEVQDEGEYTYYIICNFGETEANTTLNFIIDKSEPIINSVNVSDTCDNTVIFPEIEAGDNFSGIDVFEYRVFKPAPTEYLTNWTTISGGNLNPVIDGLNLSTGVTYKIEVKAIDNVGIESTEPPLASDGFGVISPTTQEYIDQCVNDQTPPTVIVNQTLIDGGVEVTLDCNDANGCILEYGQSITQASCVATQPYSFPLTLYGSAYVCYNATDSLDNSLFGVEHIVINDQDQDGVFDNNDACDSTPAAEIAQIESDPTSPNYGCGPSEIDTDLDSLPDFWETQYSTACGFDPNNMDSDGDGVSDAMEDCDNDTRTNYIEFSQNTDPSLAQALPDSDNDGVPDVGDQCTGTSPGLTVDDVGCADEQKDSDNDGMDDAWEKVKGLDPLDAVDANQDLDNDGLTNIEEYNEKTEPDEEDTDGDGYADGEELEKGFDPLDETSFPPALPILPIILIVFVIILLLAGAGYFAYLYTTKQLKGKIAPRAAPRPAARPGAVVRRPTVRKPVGIPIRIRKKRIESLRKRIEAKKKRRARAFEIFGAEEPKKKLSPIKPREEKILKPLAKVIKIPKAKTEFEKLAKLTEERITKKKPIEPLLKITKVPKAEKAKVEKLTKFIEKRIVKPGKRPGELTTEQKTEIRDIFSRLGELGKEKEAPFEKLAKISKRKGKTFEELSKLTKKRSKK
jgi:hypothetical protein